VPPLIRALPLGTGVGLNISPHSRPLIARGSLAKGCAVRGGGCLLDLVGAPCRAPSRRALHVLPTMTSSTMRLFRNDRFFIRFGNLDSALAEGRHVNTTHNDLPHDGLRGWFRRGVFSSTSRSLTTSHCRAPLTLLRACRSAGSASTTLEGRASSTAGARLDWRRTLLIFITLRRVVARFMTSTTSSVRVC